MKKLLLLFVVSFSTITFGQDRFEKIDSLLTYLNGNDKFMGSLTIREGENVVFNKAFGFSRRLVKNILKIFLNRFRRFISRNGSGDYNVNI